MTTYRITTDHPMSSYGEPVLIDSAGNALKAGDIGIFGLPTAMCGRVDAGGEVFWSGYGDSPDKMWRALRLAHEAHPHLTVVKVVDQSSIKLSA